MSKIALQPGLYIRSLRCPLRKLISRLLHGEEEEGRKGKTTGREEQ